MISMLTTRFLGIRVIFSIESTLNVVQRYYLILIRWIKDVVPAIFYVYRTFSFTKFNSMLLPVSFDIRVNQLIIKHLEKNIIRVF